MRISRVKQSKLEEIPWGGEIDVNVESGKNYHLFIENGKVVFKTVEF